MAETSTPSLTLSPSPAPAPAPSPSPSPSPSSVPQVSPTEIISKYVHELKEKHAGGIEYRQACDFFSLRGKVFLAKVLSALNENTVVVSAYIYDNWYLLRVRLSGTVPWPLIRQDLSLYSKNMLENKIKSESNSWATVKVFNECPALPDIVGSVYTETGVDFSSYMLRNGFLLPFWNSIHRKQQQQEHRTENRAEGNRGESNRVEGNRAESNRVEGHRAESNRVEGTRGENRHQQKKERNVTPSSTIEKAAETVVESKAVETVVESKAAETVAEPRWADMI